MRSALTDTDPATEAEHLRLLKAASVSRRFQLLRSMTASVLRLSRRAILRRNPDASPDEIALKWIALHYGADLEAEVRRHLLNRSNP